MPYKFIKPVLPVLALPFLALPVLGQALTGTSHPDQDIAVAAAADHYTKPSDNNTPPQAAAAYQDSYPATAPEPKLLPRDNVSASAALPQAAEPLQTPNSPAAGETVTLAQAQPGPDAADGDIVLNVPSRPNELHRGALLHARLRETLSTEHTAEGSLFTAELTADANRAAEVLLPAGSLIRGHVTSVHGGKRISGGASMYLRPETISLPDGTLYRLKAQVSGVDGTQDLRVTDEGKIVLHTDAKAAAAVVGGVAATAAVTGAVVGGGVGAAVGAVAGAGVGTAVYLRRDVQETLPAGTDVIFALDQPLSTVPH